MKNLPTDYEVTDAVSLISIERTRQLEDLGWSYDHDDDHQGGEMALAAACYAAASKGDAIYLFDDGFMPSEFRVVDVWPWSSEDDKRIRDEHTDERRVRRPDTVDARVRLLVKAGALIAAEIDRLHRIKWGTSGTSEVVAHET